MSQAIKAVSDPVHLWETWKHGPLKGSPLVGDTVSARARFFALANRGLSFDGERYIRCEWSSGAVPYYAEVTGKGLVATLSDRRVLLHTISQSIYEVRKGRSCPESVEFDPREYLMALHGPECSLSTDQIDYVKYALRRLACTTVKTNFPSGGVEETQPFPWIRFWSSARNSRTFRVELCPWLQRSLGRAQVRNMHFGYLAAKPILKRIYEVLRFRFVKASGVNEISLGDLVSHILPANPSARKVSRLKVELEVIIGENLVPHFELSKAANGTQGRGDKVNYLFRVR